MGYLYDPEKLGFTGPKDPLKDIQYGKAPKTSKYLDYYNFRRGQEKLKAWNDKRELQAQKELLYNDYLNQRDKTNEQFDQQVRDLRNFASKRNWSRGSSTARQNDRVIGQWGDELNQIDFDYEKNKEGIKRQLDYIEKQLKMELEGIAWDEKNPEVELKRP